jgi:hypothetical protein
MSSEEYLAQVPVNGYELESGSQTGLTLPLKWLQQQLKAGKVMQHDETISQINIKEGEIILFVKERKNAKR